MINHANVSGNQSDFGAPVPLYWCLSSSPAPGTAGGGTDRLLDPHCAPTAQCVQQLPVEICLFLSPTLWFMCSYGRVYTTDPYHALAPAAAAYGVGAMVSTLLTCSESCSSTGFVLTLTVCLCAHMYVYMCVYVYMYVRFFSDPSPLSLPGQFIPSRIQQVCSLLRDRKGKSKKKNPEVTPMEFCSIAPKMLFLLRPSSLFGSDSLPTLPQAEHTDGSCLFLLPFFFSFLFFLAGERFCFATSPP